MFIDLFEIYMDKMKIFCEWYYNFFFMEFNIGSFWKLRKIYLESY